MFERLRHLWRIQLVIGLFAIGAIAGQPLGAGPVARAQEDAFDPESFTIGFELVVEGLDRPVQVVDPGDGSGRLFVVEQGGVVRILADGTLREEPFLDISDQVTGGNEQGLLSIAFHPDFAENGVFFIDYTDLAGDTQIERWSVAADHPDRADAAGAETLLTVDQPYANHNGGLLLFGPDGYLYIGLGDGGSQGDPEGNGQNLGTLLGKILRIDIDDASGDLPYAIPRDNPYRDVEGARPEIWLYGLRNPWRFSFDRESGALFIGDVGQYTYEEIDLFPPDGAARNFGWSIMEGPDCHAASECDRTGLEPPIFAYTHDEGGCSVTGGYVYRGERIADLRGVYLAADYCSGLLWGVGLDADGEWVASAPVETGLNVSSFGEDASGELYLVDLNGGIYRVTAAQ